MGRDYRYPRFSRRDALRIGASVAVAGALPALGAAAPSSGENQIRTRRIPSSGESLPVIGLGTSRVFDVGESEADRAPCRDVLAALVTAGGSLVDSSPMYRKAEAVSGDLAADIGVTDKVFWATKVWADGREAGVEQIQESMNRFHTDQIDLLQEHNLRDWEVHMDTLRSYKEQGKIRYLGITHSRTNAFDDVESVIRKTELDFVQINYSMGEREAEDRILPLCADKGIATLINRPFMRGSLFKKVGDMTVPEWASDFGATSWGQFYLKFILAQPAVTCIIPATRQAVHMVDNVGAGVGPVPDQRQRQAMIDVFSAL